MAALIEAIEIKRKTFFEHEGEPYACLDVTISTPTARGGQTLVRVKMRNLITRAVFDKTFKAVVAKIGEPKKKAENMNQWFSSDGGKMSWLVGS